MISLHFNAPPLPRDPKVPYNGFSAQDPGQRYRGDTTDAITLYRTDQRAAVRWIDSETMTCRCGVTVELDPDEPLAASCGSHLALAHTDPVTMTLDDPTSAMSEGD